MEMRPVQARQLIVATISQRVVLRRERPREADVALPLILEFQKPSTAVLNAPVPRSARGIIWIILSLVLTLIALSGLIPVDQVVTSKGIVVAQSPTIVVQPLDTAIVRSIDVREGQRVGAGQLLARLDPTIAASDLAALVAQVSAFEAESARLKAESKDAAFNYTGDDPAWLMQAAIHGHRIAEFSSKMNSFRHSADELTSEISRAASDAAAYNDRLSFAQAIEDMRRYLAGLQVASKLQLLTAQDSRTEMARALADAQHSGVAAKRKLDGVQADRDTFAQGWHADAAQKLSDVSQKLSDAREALEKAKLHRKLVELHSDRDAIVQSIAKVSVGSVMQTGQQFITLIPADARLDVEANIFGRDIGFVRTGDKVAVKFDTFPFSQYGMADGTVKVVSPSSFTTQDDVRNPTAALPVEPQESQPYYRTRINIDKVSLHNVPEDFRVTPGMPVTADIKVGKRTVLTYLLGKIVPIAREGMREP
jgi:hemolysin D